MLSDVFANVWPGAALFGLVFCFLIGNLCGLSNQYQITLTEKLVIAGATVLTVMGILKESYFGLEEFAIRHFLGGSNGLHACFISLGIVVVFAICYAGCALVATFIGVQMAIPSRTSDRR